MVNLFFIEETFDKEFYSNKTIKYCKSTCNQSNTQNGYKKWVFFVAHKGFMELRLQVGRFKSHATGVVGANDGLVYGLDIILFSSPWEIVPSKGGKLAVFINL
mgnify:CR=1 FL=1